MAKNAYVKNVYQLPFAQPAKHINAHAWCMGNKESMGTESFNFFSICEISYGGAALEDLHVNADHCYFILEGSGYSLINGQRFEYKKGDVMWIPGNCKHEMYPKSIEGLRFVVTLTGEDFNQTEPFVRAVTSVPTAVPPLHNKAIAWPVVTPKNGGSNTIEFHITELFPGGNAEEDVHEDADHMYYFIEGTGYSIIDGERLEYGPGDALFIKRGSKHSMFNSGEGTLRMVASFGPARKSMR